ncbi:MAG: glycosyltransferase family 2 protein [Patescibacteria group bacterium]
MDLSVIIVNYRSRDKLLDCLKAVKNSDWQDVSYEVIVVENHSGDDLSEISRVYPEIKLVVSPRNLGMGAGNNLGLDLAGGRFILILNPDTFVQGRAVATLLDYLKQHPNVGLVGPKILYPDGSLQSSCARWPSFFMPILRRTFLGDYFKTSRDRFTMNDYDHESVRPVDWLMGSCLLFRRELRLAEGKVFAPRFDERYFMYFEDTDLARQIWTKGFQVVYNPEAVVIHDHGRLSARYPWYIALFRDRLVWVHIASWLKYFFKWGFKTKQKYVEN